MTRLAGVDRSATANKEPLPRVTYQPCVGPSLAKTHTSLIGKEAAPTLPDRRLETFVQHCLEHERRATEGSLKCLLAVQ